MNVGEVYSLQSSKGATPRTSNFDEEMLKKKRGGRSMSGELFNGGSMPSYPPPNPMFSGSSSGGQMKKKDHNNNNSSYGGTNSTANNNNNKDKDLHMYVWSSSASPVSEGNLKHAVNRGGTDFAAIDASRAQQEGLAAKGERGIILVCTSTIGRYESR